MIHVAVGTKPEYIKTAPVLRELERRGVEYRILDIGQHGELPASFFDPLGIHPAAVRLGNGVEVTTIPAAVRWAVGVARHLFRRRSKLRRDLFGGEQGPCIVHGDTPSTLLATALARRAGLDVCHLESGLRSFDLLQPFPEEISRILVMKNSAVHYAPNEDAIRNLDKMKVRGAVVRTPGNTAIDGVQHVLPEPVQPASGPGVVAVHRVENLHHKGRMDGLIELLRLAAATGPTRFLVHPPTDRALTKTDRWDEVVATGVEAEPLLPHGRFIRACAEARWVITDSGSLQEETALLGVPTLLWRSRTERPDGLDSCVVMSNYDLDVVGSFLAAPEEWRAAPERPAVSPAAVVAGDLIERYR